MLTFTFMRLFSSSIFRSFIGMGETSSSFVGTFFASIWLILSGKSGVDSYCDVCCKRKCTEFHCKFYLSRMSRNGCYSIFHIMANDNSVEHIWEINSPLKENSRKWLLFTHMFLFHLHSISFNQLLSHEWNLFSKISMKTRAACVLQLFLFHIDNDNVMCLTIQLNVCCVSHCFEASEPIRVLCAVISHSMLWIHRLAHLNLNWMWYQFQS